MSRMGCLRNFGVFVALLLTPLPLASQTPQLLLFGDREHNTFLGCLNCNPLDGTSVCNRFGSFGSQFSATSIWNQLSPYGSQFSPRSPWNRFASEPPVIVDRDGGFYGYFTANQFYPKRTAIPFFLGLLNNADDAIQDLQQAQSVFCGDG
jgi:hypothetical protein